MSLKHEVDKLNQGMLLPPPEARIIPDVVVQEGEGFYRPPENVLSHEQTEAIYRLEAEHKTLDLLSLESRTEGNIKRLINERHKIQKESLFTKDSKNSMASITASIGVSKAALPGIRLDIKSSFARSIGIATEMVVVFEKDGVGRLVLDEKNRPIEIDRYVTAKNPEERDKLNDQFRKYRPKFTGQKFQKRREKRRDQIHKDIVVIQDSIKKK